MDTKYTIVDKLAVSAMNTVDELLSNAGIPYAVKGGIAVQLNVADQVSKRMGKKIAELDHFRDVVFRPTDDIDLVADTDLATLQTELCVSDMGVSFERSGDDYVMAKLLDENDNTIIIGANIASQSSTPEYMEKAVARGIDVNIPYTATRDITATTMTPEDVIVGKLARWEPRDIQDTRNLFNYFKLDKDYINRVAGTFYPQRADSMLERLHNLELAIADGA